MSENAQAARAAKQRRLAEALRANLRRRKVAGQANEESGVVTARRDPAETIGAAGTEDEG